MISTRENFPVPIPATLDAAITVAVESVSAELESTLNTTRKELEQVRWERDELGAYQVPTACAQDSYFSAATSRASLQAQIATLSTTQSSSSVEAETLKHKVEDTEREKRDLVTVVSRLKDDAAQCEGKPSILHRECGRQVLSLHRLYLRVMKAVGV